MEDYPAMRFFALFVTVLFLSLYLLTRNEGRKLWVEVDACHQKGGELVATPQRTDVCVPAFK
jgi:hypothetical protein